MARHERGEHETTDFPDAFTPEGEGVEQQVPRVRTPHLADPREIGRLEMEVQELDDRPEATKAEPKK